MRKIFQIVILLIGVLSVFLLWAPHIAKVFVIDVLERDEITYSIVQTRKNVLVEPFEVSFHVKNAEKLERFYLSHEDFHWRNARIAEESVKGEEVIKIMKGAETMAIYYPDLNKYFLSSNPEIAYSPLGLGE